MNQFDNFRREIPAEMVCGKTDSSFYQSRVIREESAKVHTNQPRRLKSSLKGDRALFDAQPQSPTRTTRQPSTDVLPHNQDTSGGIECKRGDGCSAEQNHRGNCQKNLCRAPLSTAPTVSTGTVQGGTTQSGTLRNTLTDDIQTLSVDGQLPSLPAIESPNVHRNHNELTRGK